MLRKSVPSNNWMLFWELATIFICHIWIRLWVRPEHFLVISFTLLFLYQYQNSCLCTSMKASILRSASLFTLLQTYSQPPLQQSVVLLLSNDWNAFLPQFYIRTINKVWFFFHIKVPVINSDRILFLKSNKNITNTVNISILTEDLYIFYQIRNLKAKKCKKEDCRRPSKFHLPIESWGPTSYWNQTD